MSLVSPSAKNGKNLFDGVTSFYGHDDQSDRKVGGVYSHSNFAFSATEAEGFCDAFRYLFSLLQSGGAVLKAYNDSGGELAAGTLVYVSGYDAGESLPVISIADNSDPAKMPRYILTAAIADESSGFVYAAATVSDIDTSGASAVGDIVYASGTPGEIAFAAPATDEVIPLGVVTAKDASNGAVLAWPGLAFPALQVVAGTWFSGTAKIFGRKTADAGAGEEISISDALDMIGDCADGDILYRSGGTWTRLPKGTAGQVLTMNGTGTAPEWATP